LGLHTLDTSPRQGVRPLARIGFDRLRTA
jgi:hypothetical protein